MRRWTLRWRLGWAALAFLAMLVPASARQLQYGQWNAGSEVIFDITFEDFDNRRLRLRVAMPVASVRAAEKRFTGFEESDLDAAVDQAMHAYLRRYGANVEVKIERDGRTIRFVFSGTDEKRIEQVRRGLSAEIDRASQAYFAGQLLRLDGKFVLVDYVAVAHEFAQPMAPVARALKGLVFDRDERGQLAAALAMLQSIPYDNLQSRDFNNGAGFVTPPGLLSINRGDCDSKTVALATIAHHLLPGRRFVIVLMPLHALLGVDIPARPGDRTIKHDGRDYVLMEPAGPERFVIGKLFPASEKMIAKGEVQQVIQLLP